MTAIYDSGVLVAADRASRKTWADHRVRLELGLVPVTTAPVVAQVSRSSRQVQLHRFLRGCEIVGFEPAQANTVGALVAASSSVDVVDAHVIAVASQMPEPTVVTSDPDDMAQLADYVTPSVAIRSI
ncbi:MAG: hypothetical protein DRJ50_10895 [Actinobacteria bacterium]|nr:MAG: hypothetical protein DRJ50_10895 [Actinomycetota bacterium]